MVVRTESLGADQGGPQKSLGSWSVPPLRGEWCLRSAIGGHCFSTCDVQRTLPPFLSHDPDRDMLLFVLNRYQNRKISDLNNLEIFFLI